MAGGANGQAGSTRTGARSLTAGLTAGLAGTAAMTIAQALEMRVTGRAASDVPGRVASRVSGYRPRRRRDRERLSTGMHWGHGIVSGAVRGGLGLTPLRGGRANASHFALLWGSDVTLYRALDVAPWPWRWSASELATDVLHKGVYVVVTGAVFERLAPASSPSRDEGGHAA